jgi:hypothetical protein
MKTIPLEEDEWRVFLDTDEYRALLESSYSNAPSRSERSVRLEMRLMACSMRRDTVSGLVYGQFQKRETPEGEYWVAVVEGKDATDREAETRPRAVFIPEDIMQLVHARAEKKNLGDDDLLFQCSTKTIYRDVKRSAKNAATRTGNEDFRKVSPHALRRYFATHLLYRHEVPPPVVRILGGWKSDDAMFEYLVLPDDVLFERLAEAGLLGTSYDKLPRHDESEKITAAGNRLADLMKAAEASDVIDAAGPGLRNTFDDVAGVNIGTEDDSSTESTPDSANDKDQISMSEFDTDESGAVSPFSTAKVAYFVCLVSLSWSATMPAFG